MLRTSTVMLLIVVFTGCSSDFKSEHDELRYLSEQTNLTPVQWNRKQELEIRRDDVGLGEKLERAKLAEKNGDLVEAADAYRNLRYMHARSKHSAEASELLDAIELRIKEARDKDNEKRAEEHYQSAKKSEDDGEPAVAKLHYETLIANHPDSPQAKAAKDHLPELDKIIEVDEAGRAKAQQIKDAMKKRESPNPPSLQMMNDAAKKLRENDFDEQAKKNRDQAADEIRNAVDELRDESQDPKRIRTPVYKRLGRGQLTPGSTAILHDPKDKPIYLAVTDGSYFELTLASSDNDRPHLNEMIKQSRILLAHKDTEVEIVRERIGKSPLGQQYLYYECTAVMADGSNKTVYVFPGYLYSVRESKLTK